MDQPGTAKCFQREVAGWVHPSAAQYQATGIFLDSDSASSIWKHLGLTCSCAEGQKSHRHWCFKHAWLALTDRDPRASFQPQPLAASPGKPRQVYKGERLSMSSPK